MTLMSADAADHVPRILGLGAITNLLVHQMPILAEELTTTVHKLIRRDLFGRQVRVASISRAVRGRRLDVHGLVTYTDFLVLCTGRSVRQTRRIADRSRELERLSEELLQANRAKSEFLANVSHELRTPLNAVVGFAELLRDGVYGELTPRQASPVARIEASASHLRALVDQVLDLAKITAGRLEVQPEIVDLRQVALDIGTEMEPLFAEGGLAFSLNLGAAVPRVRSDPVHLRHTSGST